MKLLISVMFCIVAASSYSSEVIRLEGISIQGNSEEPNVFYITPCQEAPKASSLFSPIKSYRDKWLKPIGRKSIQREIKYLKRFNKAK